MFPLTDNQLKFISDILVAMSQVSIGSLVLEFFIKNLEPKFLVFGIVVTIVCWSFGLFINKKK